MAPALEARDIRFSYPGSEELLAGVDLQVAKGEILVLIGPNGSGKTTLMNILAWSQKPRAGRVLVEGRSVSAMTSRERARAIAMVPQEPTMAFPFSVLEIALMGRSPYLGRWTMEGRRDHELAGDALEMTGLSHLAGRRFHDLSGGEKQRAMIAKALTQNSRILLLDEPTSFLDLKHQVEIYELVRKLADQRGLAVVVVSHDLNLAAVFADRMAVLAKGGIAASGDSSEVMDPELLSAVFDTPLGRTLHDSRGKTPLIFATRKDK